MANKAIDLFKEIKSPDSIILTFLFNACAQMKTNEALNILKKVSKQIPEGFYSDSRLITSLFDALIKCGDCSSAEILFSKMIKSVTSYGNLMNGFVKQHNPYKTLKLFNQMKIDDIKSDMITYLCVIKALSQIGDYSISQSTIEQIPNDFLDDYRVQTALIDMWVS
jgi:pentatricopeptide repeat protein